MAEKPRSFTVHKISDAAWLEGVCNKTCIDMKFSSDLDDRVIFIFDLPSEEGERLLLAFGSSESFKFDSSVKNLKGKLFRKLKDREREKSAHNG
jgi:hypothetical protein